LGKGYWIVTQQNIPDQNLYARYAKLAKTTLEEFNGRSVIAGNKEENYEDSEVGLRTVIVEFDNYEIAVAAYNRRSYKKAMGSLNGTLKREFRIIRTQFSIIDKNGTRS
tara:strand:+ start:1114 stop:1440 length:327 start_codon:yes stop_codon:yes gene_type:complete